MKKTHLKYLSSVVHAIKFDVNLHKLYFDFLGLDNVDFENYFANELINMGRFLSHLKYLSSCFIRYKRSASASHFISDKALLRVL